MKETVNIHFWGQKDYRPVWQAMQTFTQERSETTVDEIWLVEHPPVFTQGQNGKPEHILNAGTIPVIDVDRGGQVTYHGPGQLVIYTLIDLKRKKWNVRQIVTHLEQSIIQFLSDYHIKSYTDCKAPGVYVNCQKICSLGLRVRRGATFHGLAFNVKMDLEPFSRINPCGFPHLKMTQLSNFIEIIDWDKITNKLLEHLLVNLGYTNPVIHQPRFLSN